MSNIAALFQQLKQKIETADFILVNGALFYTTPQNPPAHANLIRCNYAVPEGESDNEIIHFKWKTGETNLGIYLTESNINQGKWTSADAFICSDCEGDQVELQFRSASDTDAISGAEQNISINIAVACRDTNGSSTVYIASVHINQNQYDLGIHYDIAEQLAQDAGYDGPFICFDNTEHKAIIQAAEILQAH